MLLGKTVSNGSFEIRIDAIQTLIDTQIKVENCSNFFEIMLDSLKSKMRGILRFCS